MDDRNELYRTRIGSSVYRAHLMASRISTAARWVTIYRGDSFPWTFIYHEIWQYEIDLAPVHCSRCSLAYHLANLDTDVTGTTIERGGRARFTRTQIIRDRGYSYYVKFRAILFTTMNYLSCYRRYNAAKCKLKRLKMEILGIICQYL